MFATVRLRHRRTKGSGTRVACLATVFKLAEAAAKKWRRLSGAELVRDVIDGVQAGRGGREEMASTLGAELVRDVIDGVQFKEGVRAEDAAA